MLPRKTLQTQSLNYMPWSEIWTPPVKREKVLKYSIKNLEIIHIFFKDKSETWWLKRDKISGKQHYLKYFSDLTRDNRLSCTVLKLHTFREISEETKLSYYLNGFAKYATSLIIRKTNNWTYDFVRNIALSTLSLRL